MDQSNLLTMDVKPGSKIQNLVPFAVKAFQSADCRKILWRSLQGATAKTVTCAEQFKQAFRSNYSKGDISSSVEFPDLFQSSRIYLKRRDVTLEDAGLCYTLEEATIEVIISKDPIPEDASYQHINDKYSFEGHINLGASINEKPVSRKRIKHTKKRKREVPPSASEKKAKSAKTGKSKTVHSEPTEASVPGTLSYLCPRFAPGLEAVKNAFGDPNSLTNSMDPS